MKTMKIVCREYSIKEQKSILKMNGYAFIRMGKGSHEVWSNGVFSICIVDGGGKHTTKKFTFFKEVKRCGLVMYV